MNKPHKHAAEVHAWADGKEIQQRAPISIAQYQPNLRAWVPFDGFWHDHYEYRVKPDASVIETKMTDADFEAIYDSLQVETWLARVRAVANAAIARAIADGQVVTMEEHLVSLSARFDEFVAMQQDGRAARDMAVAKAMQDAIFNCSAPCRTDEHLAAIIAKVKP